MEGEEVKEKGKDRRERSESQGEESDGGTPRVKILAAGGNEAEKEEAEDIVGKK